MSDSKYVPGMCPYCRRALLLATDDGAGWHCAGCGGGWNHVENSFTGPIDPSPAPGIDDAPPTPGVDDEPTSTMKASQLAELLQEAAGDARQELAKLLQEAAGDARRELAEPAARVSAACTSEEDRLALENLSVLGVVLKDAEVTAGDAAMARVFGLCVLAQYLDGLTPQRKAAVLGDEEGLAAAFAAAFTAGMQAGVVGFGGPERRREVGARMARANPRALVFGGLVRVMRIEPTGPVLSLEMQEGIGEGVQIASNRDPELRETLGLLMQLVRAGIKSGVEEFVERTGAKLVQPGSGSGVPS